MKECFGTRKIEYLEYGVECRRCPWMEGCAKEFLGANQKGYVKECISFPLIAYSENADVFNTLRWAIKTPSDSLKLAYSIHDFLHLPKTLQLSVICWLYPAHQFILERLWEKIPSNVLNMTQAAQRLSSEDSYLFPIYSSNGIIGQVPWPIDLPNIVVEKSCYRLLVLPVVVYGTYSEFGKWRFEEFMEWRKSNCDDEALSKRLNEAIQPLKDYYKLYFLPFPLCHGKVITDILYYTTCLFKSFDSRFESSIPLNGPYQAKVRFYGTEERLEKISVVVIDVKRKKMIDHKSWSVKDYDTSVDDATEILIENFLEYLKRSSVGKIISVEGPLPIS